MKTILIYLQNSYAVAEILNSFPSCREKELRVCEKNCAVYGQDALLKKKRSKNNHVASVLELSIRKMLFVVVRQL